MKWRRGTEQTRRNGGEDEAESLKIWHGSKWFSFSIGFQLLHLATHAGCDLLARLV